MTWSDFYLICFIVGILLSVLSLVLGDMHLHFHLPFHIHFGGLHIGGPHVPHGTVAGPHAGTQLPAFNLATFTAFLAWFGGIGYLLTRHSSLYGVTALAIAFVGGLVGATLIFLAISRVLLKHEAEIEFESGDMVGMLGRITSTVLQGGTGELVYVQRGTRHSCAARGENGNAVAKGTEVIVTRYERGVAYVRPWEEMAEVTFGPSVAQKSSDEQ